MNKLYLDTSAGLLSLAGQQDEKTLFALALACPSEMAEKIIPLIKEESEKNGLSFSSYDRIYATSGPGSYTGERIALTLAKTYAFIKPTCEIYLASTLQIVSLASKGLVLALIDARNRAFFSGAYEDGKPVLEDLRREEGELKEFLSAHPNCTLAGLSESQKAIEDEFPGVSFHPAEMPALLLKGESLFEKAADPLKIKPRYLRGLNG
jgi:tRNA threonylcarbamoyladenosine biosynthesis protein TsaB